jgi:hypothetical protein
LFLGDRLVPGLKSGPISETKAATEKVYSVGVVVRDETDYGTGLAKCRFVRNMTAMKDAIAKAVMLLLFVLAAAAEPVEGSRWSFEHFPSVAGFRGTPARPALLTHYEREFRTEIRTQARTGPNFAGHYTVAKWGCGSPCVAFAIINARTGTVYAPVDPDLAVACADQNRSDASLDFKIESRLIMATGFSKKFGCGTNYFEWDGSRLKLIHFEPWPVPHE